MVVAVALFGGCGGGGGGTDPGGGGGGGGGGGLTPGVEVESNNTFATAQGIVLDSSTTGAIASAADNDWYVFTTPGAGTVTVSLRALSADADLALFDSSQFWLAGSANPGAATDTVTYLAAGPDSFHVLVSPFAPSAGYTMDVTFTPAAGVDGNDTFATAQVVAVGSSTQDVISSTSDDDWYQFTTTEAGTLTVTLSGLSADVNVALYDSTQALLGSSSNPGRAIDTVTYASGGPATFYVHLVPQATAASYTITVTHVPTGTVDGNDTFATAQAVAIGSTTQGVISTTSLADEDWYKFTSPGAGRVKVTLSGLAADADLELYGELSYQLVSSGIYAGTRLEIVTYANAGATPINYHVRVKPAGAVTPYTLTVSFTP